LKIWIIQEYYKIMNLFGELLAKSLPSYWSFDYKITIKEGKEEPFRPIYYSSKKERGALCEYLDCKLAQGMIVELDTNMETLIPFIPKPNGKLYLCVDYYR
jgi:hypothetical protein